MKFLTLKTLLISCLALILFLFLIIFFFSKKTSEENLPVSPTITIQPSRRVINPLIEFTEEEKQYVEAPMQPFRKNNQNQGSLIVVSSPIGARVMIDPPDEEIPDSKLEIPVNITPFKITNIPAGEHLITAFKDGYFMYSSLFTIEANRITRVNIELSPLDVEVGY